MVVQGVLKERADEDASAYLEWAFLAWQPIERLTIRAGRMGSDFYMLSDYRKVSFAYLWQRPPSEFYGPLMLENFDGIDVVGQWPVGSGNLRAKLFVGLTERDLEMSTRAGSDRVTLAPPWGGSLVYESEPLRLAAGVGLTRFNNTLTSLTNSGLLAGLTDPALQPFWNEANQYAAELENLGRRTRFYSLGAAYDKNAWLILGEPGFLDSDWRPLLNSLSAYLSVGRRYGNLTPYVMLATIMPLDQAKPVTLPGASGNANLDAQLSELHAETDKTYQSVAAEQGTVSLGLRWDIRHNVALKLRGITAKSKPRAVRSGKKTGVVTQFPKTQVDLLSACMNWVF